ncbi:MAG: MBL fold metallo-hydrolase [Candidatus Fermentibacterota bacterium]
MRLTFAGTRGYIEPRSRLHRMHASLVVSYYGRRVMVDCGETWLGRIDEVDPDSMVLTHAHPDHAFGLRDGAPCPVFATADTWEKEDLAGFGIEDRRTLTSRERREIEGISFEAFEVEHSTRAPAVGYRITAGRASVFYAPDVVYIPQRSEALGGCRLYIGDGATVSGSMVRRTGGALIGHTPVRTQLTWCAKEGVPEMVVTHCGSDIVAGDQRKVAAELRRMADERGVKVSIANDGDRRVLR